MYSKYFKRNLRKEDIFNIIKRVKEKKVSGMIDLDLFKEAFPEEYMNIFQ